MSEVFICRSGMGSSDPNYGKKKELKEVVIYNNMNSNILSFDIDTPIIKSIHKQTKRRQMKGKLLCLVSPYIIIIILLVLL